jgi:RHS repeat-associated protein
MFGVLDGAGALIEETLSLPGGVSVSLPVAADARWSYPNLHGDSIILTDHVGIRVRARAAFDPFGQPIDPVTGDIGTEVADDAVTDTSPGDADYAFVGQHRKLYEHQGSIATIEMGARQYVAGLGRFLEVDPVEGGVTNAYDYPADPINKFDLTGEYTADSLERVLNDRKKRGVISSAKTVWKANQPVRRPEPQTERSCLEGVGCDQTDITLTGCAIICAAVGYSIANDGAHYTTVGVGIGPELSAQLDIGNSEGKSPGVSLGASCSAALFYGGYIEGGISIPGISPYSGAGGSFGAGAGCNGMLSGNILLPWGSP